MTWKPLSSEEISTQVKDYDSLGFRSARTQSAIAFTAGVLLTIGATFMGITDIATAIGCAFIYLPLAYFVSKGHMWAMIAAMTIVTIDRLYTLYLVPTSYWMQFFWLTIYALPTYHAFQVEQSRRTLLKQECASPSALGSLTKV